VNNPGDLARVHIRAVREPKLREELAKNTPRRRP
jgi:hypothetical protein